MELKNAKLFINPAAGRWRGKKLAAKIYKHLSQHDLEPEVSFSRSKGDLTKLVKQAVINGCQTIIIAGGDGSIYEALNGIMQAQDILASDKDPTNQVKLGIIPLGTGNDFIKALNIPKNWRKACKQLLYATPQNIDVAKVITKNKSAYFINNIGSGFDAGIGITASKLPILRGKIVYVIALLWHLIKGVPNPGIEFSTDEKSHNTKMTLAAVSNGTTYGGSFKIAPQARIDDGLLDAVIAPALGRITAIPLILGLLFGTYLKRKDVIHIQCKKFSLRSDTPIPVIADGEIIDEACTEYSVEILERQIKLLI